MSRLVIFGSGDIARLAHYYFTRDSEHEVIAFTVDEKYCEGAIFLDLPLVPFEEVVNLYPADECKMFVALSYARLNKVRAEKYYVHICNNCFIGVNATLRNSITIAPETLIGAGAIIMKDTTEQGVYLPERAKPFTKKSSEIEL